MKKGIFLIWAILIVLLSSMIRELYATPIPLRVQKEAKWDNGELMPIPKGGYTFTGNPTEVNIGPNVWAFINGEEWRNTTKGTDFFHWNANIFQRYFDNSRYEFYYFSPGNVHSAEYPVESATPIPAPIILLGSGLIGFGLFRKRSKNRRQY